MNPVCGHGSTRRHLMLHPLVGMCPGPCNHNGGTGIGAGHECRCMGMADHSLRAERPHYCACGALWADSERVG